MPVDSPLPFREALQSVAARRNLPTNLSSAELMELAADVRERSLFSARTNNDWYLDQVRGVVNDILNPQTQTREDGSPFTAGLDPASARLKLKSALDRIGYEPEPEKRGTIEDLGSDQRIDLVVRMNTQMAQGYGQWRQGQDVDLLDEFPAQELFRAESRLEPRDWLTRWRGAGGRLYGGRMIARKDDPIWTEISRFGLPYPPFDFNSGMDVRDIDRDEAVELGVIDEDTEITPQRRGFEMAA